MCNCAALNTCNCDTITTTAGEKGDNGSTTVITYNTTSVITVSNNKEYTVQRLNNLSDSITSGPPSGYDWTVLTVPATGIATANLLMCMANMQISSTDTHVVTLQVKQNGSAISNLTRNHTCVTDGSSAKADIGFQFEIPNVSAGDVIVINILSSSGAVTPVFKGGHAWTKIFQ